MRISIIFLTSMILSSFSFGARQFKIIKLENFSSSYHFNSRSTDIKIHYSMPEGFKNNTEVDYYFEVSIKNMNLPIKSALGWQNFSDLNGNLRIESAIGFPETSNKTGEYIHFVRVPYSSMLLDSGTYLLDYEVKLISKSEGIIKSFDTAYLKSQDISIPKMFLCKIKINHVEATVLDSKGRGWDYTINGRRAAPDIMVKVNCNDYTIWSDYQDNTFVYKNAVEKNEIIFQTCFRDKVSIAILDIDPIAYQKIGLMNIPIKLNFENSWIRIINKFDNVQDCKIEYTFVEN